MAGIYPMKRYEITRFVYDVETGSVELNLRNRRSTVKIDNIDSIEIDTAGAVKSNASRNYVKYSFGKPVVANIEEREGEYRGTVINVHDRDSKLRK